MPGPGPMTLPWRRLALEKLLEIEKRSNLSLISKDELRAVKKEWDAYDA
jgi:hypothetical protein